LQHRSASNHVDFYTGKLAARYGRGGKTPSITMHQFIAKYGAPAMSTGFESADLGGRSIRWY
jgi:hypothetical protein